MPRLGPELSSFLFKLMHQILPTQERVSRTNPATSPRCKLPGCSDATVEDLPDDLVYCSGNYGTGLKILDIARTLVPDAGAEHFLQLNFGVEESQELAVACWLAAGFMAIWNLRISGKRVDQYLIRAELEAKINLLCVTRFEWAAIILENFLIDL